MADLFTLFDGSMGAGGSAAITRQTPGSFSDIDSENDLVATLASGSDSIDLLIDYSDFSNFVTFNSAESYVTVTADQILNSYPYDGSADDLQVFLNTLDGYQRYFLANWPAHVGHLRFNGTSPSYVRVNDFGVQDGVARTSFISPGTGSMSIQGWIDVPTLTGPAAMPVFQKYRTGTQDGITVFVSGSSLYFAVSSGSVSSTISSPMSQMPMFFAAVLDRSIGTDTIRMYTGTTGSYPVMVASSGLSLGNRFDLASGSFYFGSGTLPSLSTRPMTGSIDAFSVWNTARTLVDLSGTYNRRIRAPSSLIGLGNFNDSLPSTPDVYSSIVRDSSGHRLDGRIQGFSSAMLGSGSLIFDVPDPVLSLYDPDVVSYVVNAQVTGALYDRNNPSLIFNLFPEAFSQSQDISGDVFRNFALILARHFDRIKACISQFVNLNRVGYGEFDQAPDELLEHVARSLGWELGSGFATTDALRYFVGRGIRPGPQGNDGSALSDIKSAFWRRILQNLMYLYKTKGTGESVQAILRAHGVDAGFVRLKEYARRTEANLILERVQAEKSTYAIMVSGGICISYP